MADVKSWKSEKQRYLSLSGSAEGKDWIKWQNLKTWKQYEEASTLSGAATPLLNPVIDTSKNDSLSGKISLFYGNITKLKVDAIVNSSNPSLIPLGGVNGAIHRAAGPFLHKECNSFHSCKLGEAVITGGYKLPAKYVIHTVGPKGENAPALKSCYTNCLKLAAEKDLKTIAFPCISTKNYGYPSEAAAHVAVHAVRMYLEQHHDKFDRIVFCVYSDADKPIYERVIPAYFP